MTKPVDIGGGGDQAFSPIAGYAVLLGVAVGLFGSFFRLGVDDGYGLVAAIVHSRGTGVLPASLSGGLPGGLPGWLIGSVIGAVLTLLAVAMTRRWAPEASGSGIQEIEGTLKGLRPPLRWRRIIPVKLVGGTLAMSAGLVLGREGPTIHLGGATGAALAEAGRCDEHHRNALIAAGAGAGLAVAFNAPLGGILFVVEELRDKFALSRLALSVLIVATVVAVAMSWLLIGDNRVLPVAIHDRANVADWAVLVPFAMLIGLFGTLFNRAVISFLDAVQAIRAVIPWPFIAAAIGAVIGAMVALIPKGAGGGEELVPRLLAGGQGMTSLLLLLAVRFAAFNASYASGVPGGLFAPQLAFGTLLALLICGLVEFIAPGLILAPGRFAIAGMAALIAATVRAPLTGLALVIEMTGDFALLPFALAAVGIATFSARLCGGRPIYDELLERMLGSAAPGHARPSAAAADAT